MSTQSTAIAEINTKLDGLKSVLDNQTAALKQLSTDVQTLKNSQGVASSADLQGISDKIDAIVSEAQTNLTAISAADPGQPATSSSPAAPATTSEAPATPTT